MTANAPQATPSSSSFRLGRLLVVLVPLGLLAAGGVLGWGYFDIPAKLRGLNRPNLVPGTGTVMFAGEPLSFGQLETQHEDPNIPGAFGFVDKTGKFSLKTRIDGNFVDGAFPGKHKVTTYKMDTSNRSVMGQGPSITPEAYSSFDTTPLTLQIDRDGAKNHFDIVVEGEPRVANPEMAARMRANAAGTPPVDPQQVADFVTQQLQQNDKDGDQKLSKDELSGLQGMARMALQNADGDGDGLLDQKELEAAASQLLSTLPGAGLGGGGGGGAGGFGGAGGRGRGKPQRPETEDEQAKPAEQPAAPQEKPDSESPAEKTASPEKPAAEKPGEEKPGEEKSVEEKPAPDKS